VERDFYDLARAVGRKAKAVVGDVEVAIGANGEAGGKEEAGGDDRVCAVFVDADDLAETRSGAGSADGVFEDIQVVFVVEVETEDCVETGGPDGDVSRGSDFENDGGAGDNGESVEVADVEVAVVIGDYRGNDVTLRGGNVGDAADGAVGRNRVEFPVIGLDGVETSASRDHAVPRAIRFEVPRIFMLCGIVHDKVAEVGDLFPSAIGVDAKDTVAGAEETVGAAGASFESVEVTAQEGDIGYTAHKIAEGGASLTGRKMVGDGGDVAEMIDFRNARRKAARVGAGTIGKPGGLRALADGGEIASGATLGDI